MARFTIYRSTDANAPVLTGQVGSLVALLDACLVNGYTASITSITRSGGTATVTAATTHNLITGQSVTIAGANETDYNGTFAITVTSPTAFTYTVPGSPASPATGTITFLRIAAGWTKPFTGTNKAAFRQGSGSNQFYVRLQDDGPGAGVAREARVVGYETMSDVDTGTQPFPTVAQFATGMFIRKSSTADATARAWIIAADARTFYLFVLTGDSAGVYLVAHFGEFYSLLPADGFRVMIVARGTENSGTVTNDVLDTGTSNVTGAVGRHYVARGHNGTGGAVNIGKHGDSNKWAGTGPLIGIVPYTNPANGAFYLSRVWIHDPTTTPANGLRGRMRGFWHWLHAIGGVTDGDALIGSGELAGKTFLVVKTSGNSAVYIIETSDTVETN